MNILLLTLLPIALVIVIFIIISLLWGLMKLHAEIMYKILDIIDIPEPFDGILFATMTTTTLVFIIAIILYYCGCL